MKAKLVILCGLPGSGKTTRSTELSQEFSAIHMCPDDWMDDLGIDIWNKEARVRIEALQWKQTQELLALGNTVIIDWGVWSRDERDELREGAHRLGATAELLFLECDLDELWRRVDKRNSENDQYKRRPMTREELVHWCEKFEAPTGEELALYDN